jgi:hypothetical protein
MLLTQYKNTHNNKQTTINTKEMEILLNIPAHTKKIKNDKNVVERIMINPNNRANFHNQIKARADNIKTKLMNENLANDYLILNNLYIQNEKTTLFFQTHETILNNYKNKQK